MVHVETTHLTGHHTEFSAIPIGNQMFTAQKKSEMIPDSSQKLAATYAPYLYPQSKTPKARKSHFLATHAIDAQHKNLGEDSM